MSDRLRLNDKPAVKINGKEIRPYNNSTLVNCEGDEVWLPTDRIKINSDGTILIEEWLYNAKVKEGKL